MVRARIKVIEVEILQKLWAEFSSYHFEANEKPLAVLCKNFRQALLRKLNAARQLCEIAKEMKRDFEGYKLLCDGCQEEVMIKEDDKEESKEGEVDSEFASENVVDDTELTPKFVAFARPKHQYINSI